MCWRPNAQVGRIRRTGIARNEDSPLRRERRFESIRIVGFATAAAIVYGILHDQVTAHLCVEYFTVAHPPVFRTTSPFWLAIGWGIIATWWVGLPLGIGLALAARAGRTHRLTLADLRPSILLLMFFSGLIAIFAGVIGGSLVAAKLIQLPADWRSTIPPDKHVAFAADAWAHLASYLSGAAGGLFLIVRATWLRWSETRLHA
jgi:hypothetical protein